jgi:hypothetical protein
MSAKDLMVTITDKKEFELKEGISLDKEKETQHTVTLPCKPDDMVYVIKEHPSVWQYRVCDGLIIMSYGYWHIIAGCDGKVYYSEEEAIAAMEK